MCNIILQKEHILGSPLQRIPVTILLKYIMDHDNYGDNDGN